MASPGTVSTAQSWTDENGDIATYVDRVTGRLTSLALTAAGLPGATASSRHAGGTASGAPQSGSFIAGDFIIDQTGAVWVCTAGGSPGTWAQIAGGSGSSAVASVFGRTGAVTAQSGDYTAGQVGADTAGAAAAETTRAEAAEALRVQVAGDIGGTPAAPTVTSTHLASPLPAAQGGTGQATAAAGLAALGGMGLLATTNATGLTGYTLVNGTGTILTWTAPSDGNMHRVVLISDLHVTSTQTGGAITMTCFYPDGFANAPVVAAGSQSTGGYGAIIGRLVEPGSTVTVTQSTALTGGAAVLWCELWGL